MSSSRDDAGRTYCIIGDPVDHSLSPTMHNAAFKALNLNCTYIALRVAREELDAAVQSLRKTGSAGFNVTMPHKVAIMKFLDELDPTCNKINAVNTVNSENGKLRGYNTDIDGFIEPLRKRKVSLRGKAVLVMGAGGAARAVLTALAEEGVAKTVIASRNPAKARDVAEHANKQGLDCEIVLLDEAPKHSRNADLIVNATPLGMKREPSVLGPKDIRADSIVYDLVYVPMETPLIANARKAGATVVYGYEMLVEQGARSFEIWKRIEAPRDVMKRSLVGDFIR